MRPTRTRRRTRAHTELRRPPPCAAHGWPPPAPTTRTHPCSACPSMDRAGETGNQKAHKQTLQRRSYRAAPPPPNPQHPNPRCGEDAGAHGAAVRPHHADAGGGDTPGAGAAAQGAGGTGGAAAAAAAAAGPRAAAAPVAPATPRRVLVPVYCLFLSLLTACTATPYVCFQLYAFLYAVQHLFGVSQASQGYLGGLCCSLSPPPRVDLNHTTQPLPAATRPGCNLRGYFTLTTQAAARIACMSAWAHAMSSHAFP